MHSYANLLKIFKFPAQLDDELSCENLPNKFIDVDIKDEQYCQPKDERRRIFCATVDFMN